MSLGIILCEQAKQSYGIFVLSCKYLSARQMGQKVLLYALNELPTKNAVFLKLLLIHLYNF